MSLKLKTNDHTAAYAEAFYIANLLFVGIFYLALWALYFLRNKNTSPVAQHHLKQTLLASSITTLLFIAINIFIMLTVGYASAIGLFSLEFYFMIILPLCLIVGILGFTKAIKNQDFTFPLIGRFVINSG